MKKILSLAALSALALAAMLSCQREPQGTENPNFDPKGNTVKAKFTMSLSTNNGPEETKTTAAYAQINSAFLGMEQVHLLTYAVKNGEGRPNFYFNPWKMNPDGSYAKDGENKMIKLGATRDFDLGELFPAKSTAISEDTRTVELAIPLETDCVVIYGKAKKSSGSSDLQGAVSLAGDVSDLSTIRFTLVPRLDDIKKFNVGATAFARILNYIVCSGLVQEKRTTNAETGALITGFWKVSTGNDDKSYGFWWPQDASTPTAPGANDGAWDGTNTHQYHKGQLSWKQLGQMYQFKYDSPAAGTDPNTVVPGYVIPPLAEPLGEAYYTLTNVVKSGELKELRAGSAQSVLRTMSDLYSIVDKISNASTTSWQEEVAKQLGAEIKAKMEEFFVRNSTGFFFKTASGDGRFTTSEVTAFVNKVNGMGNPYDGWNYEDAKALFNADYFPYSYTSGESTITNAGFPINIGLPFGASCMNCTVTVDANNTDYPIGSKVPDIFAYVTDIPAYGMGTATFPIKNYRYPPELMYYGNSPVRVSDQVVENWPSSLGAWDNAASWDSWNASGNASKVTSTTRSVAMIDHINYGNALLKSRVMFASGVTALKDNNAAIHNNSEADNNVPLTGLVVTGLVVGGQPDAVCWDFTRAVPDNDVVWTWSTDHYTNNGAEISFDAFGENPANQFDKMIYDRVEDQQIASYAVEPSGGEADPITPIYTLCWDNYDATKDAANQQDVYVALEIKNNTGKDFWGELNLVRNGGTFYLVGKLSASQGIKPTGYKKVAGTDDWDLSRSNYQYPPFDPLTGATINVPRVFMQDYMTTANLILGEDALKHAYVTMPDLRSSQITLGVAIDMNWSKGLTYNVNMGVLE